MTALLSRSRIVSLVALGVLLAGCDTITERVRATREVQVFTHEYEATADEVMAVVPAALNQMGYSITAISNASDVVEAITDIRRDSGFRNSRQTRIKFTVVDRDGGYSLGSLQAWDIHEEENARGERFMSEIGVPGPGFHNSIFETIGSFLPKKAK